MKPFVFSVFFLPILLIAQVQPSLVKPVLFVGIQTHFGQGKGDPDSLLQLAKAAGIGAIRDEMYWSDIEKVRNTFSFTPGHDVYIKSALRRGIKPLIILDYGNDLYGGTPRDSASREAFGRYCKAVVGRYAPLGVKDYEIWNEPNVCVPGFCTWSPGPNPSEYVELLKVAYRACKAVDAGINVIGCATSPLDEPETLQKIPGAVFISRVFQLGGGDYMDAVSFHLYPFGRTPEQAMDYECERILSSIGDKPMWITETGYPTVQTSEEDQANFIVRIYLLGRSIPQLRRIFWYDLQDDCGDPTNAECRWGILREDRSPKLAYPSLRTLAATVGSKPFVSMMRDNNEYVGRFGTPGNQVIAFWRPSGQSTKVINVGSKYFALVDRDGGTQTFIVPESLAVVTLLPKVQYIVPLAAPRSGLAQ